MSPAQLKKATRIEVRLMTELALLRRVEGEDGELRTYLRRSLSTLRTACRRATDDAFDERLEVLLDQLEGLVSRQPHRSQGMIDRVRKLSIMGQTLLPSAAMGQHRPSPSQRTPMGGTERVLPKPPRSDEPDRS